MNEHSFDFEDFVELMSELRDEKITPERKEQLESILKENSEARSYFVQFMRLHGLFEQRAIGIDSKSQKDIPSVRSERSLRSLQPLWAAAAAIVIATIIWWTHDSKHNGSDSVHTRLIGNWILSTSDETAYDILDETRVHLDHGEILLTRTPQNSKPLYVETQAGVATLAGKKFLVGTHTVNKALNKKSQTRVLVLDGTVKLTNPAGSESGTEGDILVIDNSETAPIQISARANSSFGLNLYRELVKSSPNENLVLSPYSLAINLSMTVEAARSDAASELWEALHFPESAQRVGLAQQQIPWETAKIHTGMKALREHLNTREDLTFTLANCLWVDKRFPLYQNLLATLSEAHGALIHEADFRNNATTERARLNDRVALKTGGLVGSVLPENSVNKETRLVLANAVYFMGKWDKPFLHDTTKKNLDFTLSDGRVVKTTYLQKSFYETFQVAEQTKNQINRFRYAELKTQEPDLVEFQALEIPYKGERLSMLVLLPQKNSELPVLERALTSENVSKWIDALKEEAVSVALPRFRLQSELSLRNVLEELGIISAFQPGGFASISNASDAAEELFLSRVQHNATVEINETGTEANSSFASLTQGPSLTRSPLRPRIFNATHPFLFLIRDQRTGAILFVGRLLDPSQS